MSDFLGNLIARSFVPAAAIRPRPVSRFEPAAESEALQADPAPEAQLSEQAIPQIHSRTALPPARAIQPLGQRAGDDQPIANNRLQPSPPAIEPSESRTSPTTYESPSARLSAPALASPALNSHAAPALAAPLGSQIAALRASQDWVTHEHQIVVERVTVSERRAAESPSMQYVAPAPPERLPVQPITPPTAVLSTDLTASQQVAPYAPPEAAAQPQPAPRMEKGLSIRPAATIHSEASLAPIALTPRAADPPAPTIQVTIGRIEVRASAAPARSPQSARSGPALMSLDEYLRRRGQEGNR